MTGADRAPGGAPGDGDPSGHFGGRPDDVALFALAHAPRRRAPLSEADAGAIRAAVGGVLPGALSGPVRDLVRGNAAAAELVLDEQLLANANRMGAVPAHLTDAVLRRAGVAASVPAARAWSRSAPRRRSAAVFALAAGLAAAFVLYALTPPAGPNFEIVALADVERQAIEDGAGLHAVQVEEPTDALADFFADGQTDRAERETRTLSTLTAALHQAGHPEYLFDAALKADLAAEKTEAITLRVYDLTDPANRRLINSLRLRVDSIVAAVRHEKLDLVVSARTHA